VINLTVQERLVFPESRAPLQEARAGTIVLLVSHPPIERPEVDTPTNSQACFGVFELDARTGELRRAGHRVALQPQPLEILPRLSTSPLQKWRPQSSGSRVTPDQRVAGYLSLKRSAPPPTVEERPLWVGSGRSPMSAIGQKRTFAELLNYLVCAQQERLRNRKAKCLRGQG
jgi:hypothetical protein